MTTRQRRCRNSVKASDASRPQRVDDPPDLRMASLVQKEGFSALAEAAPPERPDDLTIDQYRNLTARATSAYNEQRRIYHANYGPIATPMLTRATAVLDEVYETNRYKRGDKLCTPIILSAPAGLGKSTLVVDFAQSVFRERRAGQGDLTDRGDEYIPVGYISLNSKPTPRSVDLQICEFYGEPMSGVATQLELRAADSMRKCKTELFIVDECQFIDQDQRLGPETVNHLKSLVNLMPGTFIFVGTGMFKDEQLAARRLDADKRTRKAHDHILLQQMKRRWIPLAFEGFTLSTTRERQEWKSVLLTIERDLVLCNKRPGMLIDLSEYLFARSSGHTASLMSLVVRAAHRAMESGDEKLSRGLLDKVKIDAAAERQRQAYVAQFATGQLSVLDPPE